MLIGGYKMQVNNFRETVEFFYSSLLKTDSGKTGVKISSDKWSLKEIIGHLVDSASNNHQRFVRLQFGDLRDFPAYDGEDWIRVQGYNKMEWELLIKLWHYYNLALLNIIENVDNKALSNEWIGIDIRISLEDLIIDYYRHLNVHIKHFTERQSELENI